METRWIEASALCPDGVEASTEAYYAARYVAPKPVSKKIGPIIRGLDVGLARQADLHPDYLIKEMAREPVDQKDTDLGGFRVRWFHPGSVTSPGPAVLFLHGGGYLTGTINRYDPLHRYLAEQMHGVVIHVDFTLSPETGFPTALEQAYRALNWMLDNGQELYVDPSRTAVMGDSSGGNCAAALILKDREKRRLRRAYLYYPLVDMTDAAAEKLDLKAFGEPLSPLVEQRIQAAADAVPGLRRIFLQNGEDPANELISPLYAKDLSCFPSTVFLLAQYDFMTLQSMELARRLESCGRPVKVWMFGGAFHGFLDRLGVFEASQKSLDLIAQDLRMHLETD